jgi:hypothetical protein
MKGRILLLLLLLLFLFLALPAAVLFLSRSSTPICKENYERIEVGMTQADVEGILGGPPGEHYKGPLVYDWLADAGKPLTENEAEARFLLLRGARIMTYSCYLTGSPPDSGWKDWVSDRTSIGVCFDADKVIAKDFMPVRPRADSLLAKLRLWLHM